MCPWVKQFCNAPRTLTFYSHLIDYGLSSKSLHLTKKLHAQLIKVGFNNHTFLGNRFLELYNEFRCINDISKAFNDITRKNNISWNIYLKGLFSCGCSEMGLCIFQKMPAKDVVSWNSIISWHASCGQSDFVSKRLHQMLHSGVKPSGYTYSILASMVSDPLYARELHGSMIRSGLMMSNVVLGNSLINMYGKLEYINYAFGVFCMMKQLDVISWNSLIMGFRITGYSKLALNQFSLMRSLGYSPDKYTYSSIITCCTYLRDLERGKQVFSICMKVGLHHNAIISSAIIDLFSKCNRLQYSVQFFQEVGRWDSVICDSLISSYTWHDVGVKALELFVLMLRKDIRPTGFSLSSLLSSLCVIPAQYGTQIHSLVIKSGFEMDGVVCSSLVYMYAKFGFIDDAIKIFARMVLLDLVSWNTMIMGLTHNGRLIEAIETFKELCAVGPKPDHISVAGVMLACNYGGFTEEGMAILTEMIEQFDFIPSYEHYSNLVDLFCQAGRVNEAIKITEKMYYRPKSTICVSLLCASVANGDLILAEKVATQLMDCEEYFSLPYLILARIYEMRGLWEDVVRVRNTMKRTTPSKASRCSWIVINNYVYTFVGEQGYHHAGQEIYAILKLLTWESGEMKTLEGN